MSAIVGIYYLNGQSVARPEMVRMMEELAHRGPDGAGIWLEGSVALGHCMLWTTPESLHERLPLADRERGLVLTADARLDNREDLIRRLGLGRRAPKEITDSELILAAYEKWGEQCAENLIGDFAFALWDQRNRKLFCARDHFGVKPFYFYSSADAFAFSTELKALLCLPEVPHRLNEMKVAEYLSGLVGDGEATFYQDILRLEPGHKLVVSCENARSQPYWSFDLSRELRLKSDNEYAEAFREIFTEAVRSRLRSAYPVGSMLSGGLDSSSITCVARNLMAERGERLHTFSAIFDDVAKCDERPFINAVLAQNGVVPHFVHGDHSGPLTNLHKIFQCYEEASAPANMHYIWRLYSGPIRDHGVRIVLDGFDGDTTVSHGVGYLIELARYRRWLTLAREARGYCKHFDNCPPWPVIWWHIQRYGLSPRTRRSIKPFQRAARALKWRVRRLAKKSGDDIGRVAFVNEEFIDRINLKEHHSAAQRRKKPGPILTEREFHHHRLTQTGLADSLEALNKVAGAFSMETRFPFWDIRLAEFCLALPPEQKLNRGWNRMVMRRAMNEILPQEVQWRGGKADMSHSFEYGMRHYEREQLEEAVVKHLGAVESYVKIDAVRKAYQRFLEKKATPSDMMGIWKSVSLALWLQCSNLTP